MLEEVYNIKEDLPDVQGETPLIPLNVNNVCVQGLKIRLCSISSNNRLECYTAEVSACVDLSSEFRGIHVSRSVESILNIINDFTYGSLLDLQNNLRVTAEQLLIKHKYSSKATIKLRMSNLYRVKGEDIPITLRVGVKLFRNGCVKYYSSLDINGMTVCPCTQQIYSFIEGVMIPNTPSHSQRVLLSVKIISSRPIDLNLNEVIDNILPVFSTPVKSFLKKSDEYRLVKKAFENPKFAEDVAREVMYRIYKLLRDGLSDDARVIAEVISYESIHPFNLYVKINHDMRELDEIFSRFR